MNTPNNAPLENPEAEKTIRIRTLNDAFRTTFVGGRVMFSSGIRILETPEILAIVEKIKTFDAFTPDNDPHCEHDFGAIKHNGKNIFWKLDYYDETMTYGSEDASDTEQTTRVLTVMLAEEY